MILTEQEVKKLEILIKALRLKLSQSNLCADAMATVDYSTVELLDRIVDVSNILTREAEARRAMLGKYVGYSTTPMSYSG